MTLIGIEPIFWLHIASAVVNHIAIGAGGTAFDSQAGQIEHNVANGSPPLRRFFGAVLPARWAEEMGPAACYALRRNTEDVMKI